MKMNEWNLGITDQTVVMKTFFAEENNKNLL